MHKSLHRPGYCAPRAALILEAKGAPVGAPKEGRATGRPTGREGHRDWGWGAPRPGGTRGLRQGRRNRASRRLPEPPRGPR